MPMSACIGVLNSVKTIIMLKICNELPDMYIIIAFMGSDLAGAMATSQAFFTFSVSVSSGVGPLRGACLEDDRCKRVRVSNQRCKSEDMGLPLLRRRSLVDREYLWISALRGWSLGRAPIEEEEACLEP